MMNYSKLVQHAVGYELRIYKASFYTLPLVMIETFILTEEELCAGNDNGGIGVQQITCAYNSNAFIIFYNTINI